MKFASPRLVKCLLAALLVLGVLSLMLFAFRAPLLRESANLWIVNQPLTNADAIVVLGGGLDTRPFAAARLFQRGLAPMILIMSVRPSPSTQLGLTPTEEDLTRKELLSEGVPETHILVIGNQVATSYDESLAVRDWVKRSGARRIIIPTDLFHTRRVRWLYAKELAGLQVDVMVMAVPLRHYSATNWWQNEEGLIAFQNEIIKLVYYRIKY